VSTSLMTMSCGWWKLYLGSAFLSAYAKVCAMCSATTGAQEMIWVQSFQTLIWLNRACASQRCVFRLQTTWLDQYTPVRRKAASTIIETTCISILLGWGSRCWSQVLEQPQKIQSIGALFHLVPNPTTSGMGSRCTNSFFLQLFFLT